MCQTLQLVSIFSSLSSAEEPLTAVVNMIIKQFTHFSLVRAGEVYLFFFFFRALKQLPVLAKTRWLSNELLTAKAKQFPKEAVKRRGEPATWANKAHSCLSIKDNRLVGY